MKVEKHLWVSVQVKEGHDLCCLLESEGSHGLTALQAEKGSFLQISLCIGTKSVDNILTKIVVVDVLCFILFVFFYWC